MLEQTLKLFFCVCIHKAELTLAMASNLKISDNQMFTIRYASYKMYCSNMLLSEEI